MLKQDKLKLNLILSMLYATLNYFRIKKNGTIICKKNWWSFKKHTTSLRELAVDIVPTAIGKYSDIEAGIYEQLINAVITSMGDNANIISTVHSNFDSFVKRYRFIGIEPDLKYPNPLKFITRWRLGKFKSLDWWEDQYEALKIKVKTGFKTKKVVTAITNSITTLEEKANESLKLTKKVIASVCTGDEELDAKYRTIIRYLSPEPNLYCI